MTASPTVKFGFQLSAEDAVGASDVERYQSMLRFARLNYELGYDAAWMIEHHFSEYFPTPAPMSILAHVAAACPGLGLGTSVLVLPWHQPVRIAGEIAVLSHLSSGDLYIGLGRGNAPYEYEIFGVDMAEAKDRFAETWRIIDIALDGEPFTFEGKHFRFTRPVTLRPKPIREKISFLGAIGNPASAQKIADLRLPPICNGNAPFEVQKDVLSNWTAESEKIGAPTNGSKAVGVLCVVADSDDEAYALGRRFFPRWFELQVEHYAFDANRHSDLPDYRPFAETHERRIKMTNPDNLGPLFDVSLMGSPKTVAERVQKYIDAGFDHLIVQTTMPGVPEQHRNRWMTRFAKEVAPNFSSSVGRARRAA